jgi:integrase
LLTWLLSSEVGVARKRANNEGSIYKNERRGRWEAVLVVDHKPDGRPIRRTFTGRTRTAATAKLDEARKALEHGLEVPDTTTTIADYAAWWIEHVLPGEGLAPKTEKFYREMLGIAVPVVGQRTLTGRRALTVADVEALCARQRTPRTADAVRTTLSKMLRSAEARGLVGRNVARLSRRQGDRGKARDIKAHTVAEIDALLAALDGTVWHPIVVVGVTTGLRPGELLALHWPDVHMGTDPHVSVRQSLTYVDDRQPERKAPKRQRSYRTVPLVPEAVTTLKAWRKTQAADQLRAGRLWSTDWPELVFTASDGRPHGRGSYGRALRAAGSHPHRLRHTYATHLLEAGTPIHHVAELLGDTVATVEGTYSHVLRAKHEVVAVARGLLGGAT